MERKIGEQFNYEGVTLEVARESDFDFCEGCFFNNEPFCKRPSWVDLDCIHSNVIFKEVKK